MERTAPEQVEPLATCAITGEDASVPVPGGVPVEARANPGRRVGAQDVAVNSDYASLGMPLPTDIARLKGAGKFSAAATACRELMASGEAPELAARLRIEAHRLSRLAQQYSASPEQALEELARECPGFTREDLERLMARGRIDWRMVEGEVRFVGSYMDALRVYAHEIPGLKAPHKDTSARDAAIAQMRERGVASWRMTLRASLAVPGAHAGERVRAWLPVAAACPQQSEIEVLAATPGAHVAADNVAARTASWSLVAGEEPAEFSVTYRYRIDAPYVDLWSEEGVERAFRQGVLVGGSPAPAPTPADLSELAPHIVFSPLVCAAAQRVREAAKDGSALELARAAYDYVTNNVDYRFQPAYAQLDCISETCLASRRGDCGVMALTFITLCRALGVPARWQSGLYTTPSSVGPHDWAMFYVEGIGWLWADCSFGSSARREGAEQRRRHYFGNLDPWRTVCNSAFFAEFEPPTDGVRWDPYDNQTGEASVEGRGCDSFEMPRTIELLEAEQLG